MQDWSNQWKMSLNPDLAKQAQEVILSRKTNKIVHLPIYFNSVIFKLTHTQKHVGLQLDSKLSFIEHTNNKTSKATKALGLLRKLQPILPCTSLLTIYKSFVRRHLDYGDVIYDQPSNASFSNKIESAQYNAALAIAGAIKGSYRDKFYREMGLEYLQQRR